MKMPQWVRDLKITTKVTLTTLGVLTVGIVGFVTSLFFWQSWGGFGGRETTVSRERVIER